MKRYLNHFDLDLRIPLATLRQHGWDGLRRNVWSVTDARKVLNQHILGLDALLLLDLPPSDDTLNIVRGISNLASLNIAIEIGNEWDIKGISPEVAFSFWRDCINLVSPIVTLVTGGVSSVSDKAYGWMKQATEGLPLSIVVGVHGYGPEPKEDPERYARYSDRVYWQTEVGWDRGPHKKDFPFCWQTKSRSEEEQAACFREDVKLAKAAGFGVYSAYQVADGPANGDSGNYHGLYREDGSPRPAVPAVTEVV